MLKWILKCFSGNLSEFNLIFIGCECQWLLPLSNLDMMKLRQAKEEHERLDAENRSLWERIRTMGSEKKDLPRQVCMSRYGFVCMNPVKVNTATSLLLLTIGFYSPLLSLHNGQEDAAGEPKDRSTNGELQNHLSHHESDDVHKR